MSNVLINGHSCYLKDRSDNILLPKTDASLVTFTDGNTLEEKMNKVVDFNKLSELNDELKSIRENLTRLQYDIGTTANYYKLKEVNNNASELISQVNSIKNSIENFDNLELLVDGFNNRLKMVEERVNTNSVSLAEYIESATELLNNLMQRITTLEYNFEEFPNGKIVTVEKTVVQDESGLLINSLLSTVDMYEVMCSTVNGFVNKEVPESIIDAYVSLYKLEIKKITDMPSNIQDLVSVKLL